MKQIQETFIEQIDKLFQTFPNYCGASALFFKGTEGWELPQTVYGLRVEAPAIAKEFVSNVMYGSGEYIPT